MKHFTLASLAIFATVALANDEFLMYPSTSRLDETEIFISYNASLPCAACIRGGYFYCQPEGEE